MPTTVITVMFTDLIGSTELLTRVGEARAEELRREQFATLRAAIEETGGREVKNLGDGLMVAFDGSAAAMACAVTMQQQLEARPASAEPLAIRIGVSAGEVDMDDGDYFGLPVVEAARLCARAGTREILVTDMVRMLARSRSDAEFEPVGDLQLKGLAEPVAAHRVRWTPLPTVGAAVPVPDRLGALVGSYFVGRADESARIAQAYEDAAGDGRRVVLLDGEPGIGKSTLTAAAASEAAELGAFVLYGRCDEDLFVPYQPWVEALGHLVAHGPQEMLDEHVAERGGVLSRLVPELERRTGVTAAPSLDDDTERHLLFGAVADLMSRAAVMAPVVLVLDDLHWADEPTVQLLRHVITASAPQRFLVLGTFRDSEVARGGTLAAALAALHRERCVERIALRGLGDADLLAFLEMVAGHEMNASGVALRDALLAETDGNPFFVTELLRHLSDTGCLFQDHDGVWHVAFDLDRTGLPVSIREVIGGRVQRLGAETARVLALAAVIGRDFEVGLLARVAGLSEDRVVDLCDAAVDAAVLHETGIIDRYTFAHALIERTLYDDLSATRRARTHRVVAEALEEQFGDDPGDRVGELAHHWAQGTRPQDTAKAVHYARLAGQRALRQLAPTEAVRWFTYALANLPEAENSTVAGIDLSVGLGEAQRLVGDPAHRVTLLNSARHARDAGASGLLVRAALANTNSRVSSIGEVDHERVEVLRAALDAVGPQDSIDRARLLAVLCAELQFDLDGTSAGIAEDAVAMARRLGDTPTFVFVTSTCSAGKVVPEHLADHLLDMAEACRLADDSGDPTQRVLAHWAGAFACADAGDRNRLEEHARILRVCAGRTGIASHRWFTAHVDALAAMFAGDLDVLEAAVASYLAVGIEVGYEADTIAQWAPMMITVAQFRGTFATLIPSIESARAENPGLPVYAPTLAWALAIEGDLAAARTMLHEARVSDFHLPMDLTWLIGQSFWMEVAHRVDDQDAVAVVLDRIEPWGHLMTCCHTGIAGVVWHYVGRGRLTLRDVDGAIEDLERALEAHQEMRAPHLIATSEVALAEALLASGGRQDLLRARTLAESALATAEACGYGYVRRDATAVLSRPGAAKPGFAGSGVSPYGSGH